MHSPLVILVVLGVGWAAIYWISLRLHPFIKCKACGGTGRHTGMIFTSATRACGVCGGTSRVPRRGVNQSTMKYQK